MAGEVYDIWPAGATATMNVTYTQANAAGGAVTCEITPGSGNEFIVMAGKVLNSGTNGIAMSYETGAGGTAFATMLLIASGVATNVNFTPGLVNTSATTTGTACGVGYPIMVSGTQALKIFQTGAGAQNDTFQIIINIRCKGAVPTVTHANSTNPANVSVTAGAESFAVI